MVRTGLPSLLVVCLLVAATTPARATSMRHQNVADLIGLSELILTGRVVALTDGFQNGIPYTEVTVSVDEAIRGKPGQRYTFRQFGLMAPRELANGQTYLVVSPDGLPRFALDEDVLLFLYRKANQTGLQTTVGLFQGKFKKDGNRFENGVENIGLMSGVSINPSLLSPGEQKLLKAKKGPVQADVFLEFVRNAVRNRWVETGRLSHVR